jgi:uncharacterized protein (DUF924 family)
MRDSKTAILEFWFTETKPAQWFQKNPDFDDIIRARFTGDYDLASAGIYDGWMDSGDGALALTILLDQFPRNMFRDSPLAFGTDGKALAVATHALERHFDRLMPPERRRFLYLPFEHAETMEAQDRAVALFEAMKKDDPLGYDYAIRHRDVIARFGRFPHRNAVLGRASTPAELEYLKDPSSGF